MQAWLMSGWCLSPQITHLVDQDTTVVHNYDEYILIPDFIKFTCYDIDGRYNVHFNKVMVNCISKYTCSTTVLLCIIIVVMCEFLYI